MMRIRAADLADIAAVSELERVIFAADAWSGASVENEFEAIGSTRHVVVAVEAECVVGYGVLRYAAGSSDVQRVAVALDHRRRGLARALTGELLSAARRLGCDEALLEVAADNVAAMALYDAFGFAEIGRRPRYYADDVDAVVMRCALVASSAVVASSAPSAPTAGRLPS